MPRRKPVPSLEKLCVTLLCDDIQKITSEEQFKLYNQKFFLNEDSRLSITILAPILMSELFQELERRKAFNWWNLKLFLTSDRRKLDFSALHLFQLPKEIIKIIPLNCKKLKILNLEACDLTAYEIGYLIQSLPRLTSLNLNDTKCDCSTVETIFRSCKNLQELTVSAGINDKLLERFTSSSSRPCCQKLRELAITDISIRISPSGISAILKIFPNLQFLFVPTGDIPFVFERLESKKSDLLQPLKLKYMYSGYKLIENVELVHRFCPFLTGATLYFFQPELFSELSALDKFEHLTNLELSNWSKVQISFANECLNLLERCGPRLGSLILGGDMIIDISQIGYYCPNLTSLELDCQEYMLGDSETSINKLFFNLTKLYIKFNLKSENPHESESAQSIRFLLKHSPNLEHLTMVEVSFLSNELLKEILQENQLLELKTLKITIKQSDPFIDFAIFLKNDCSKLEKLHLQCKATNMAEYEELYISCQEYVKKLNLDVDLAKD